MPTSVAIPGMPGFIVDEVSEGSEVNVDALVLPAMVEEALESVAAAGSVGFLRYASVWLVSRRALIGL